MEATCISKEISVLLRYHREAAGLTPAAVARLLYIPHPEYERMEEVWELTDDLELIERFCKALSLTIPEFLQCCTNDKALLAEVDMMWRVLKRQLESMHKIEELEREVLECFAAMKRRNMVGG